MDNLERTRALFAADRFATEVTGIVIEAADKDYAKCSLQLTPAHMNAAGVAMGGAIYTLADFTFAVASNYEAMNTLSLCANITYLSAATGGKLTAESSCVRSGRSTCYFVINVTDESGRLIASMTTSGFRR